MKTNSILFVNFLLYRSKTVWSIFGGLKNKYILKMSISNFSFWRLFFALIKRRYLQIFQNKIFIFKAPLILWKLKLCCPCDWCMWLKLPIFWNWTSKNITDRQQCVGFQKSKKVLNHSTLVGTLLYKFCDGNDFGFAKLVFILTPFSCKELCVRIE